MLTIARAWGDLWHRTGGERLRRNQLMRERDACDYRFVDWLWGPAATDPAGLPPMFTPHP